MATKLRCCHILILFGLVCVRITASQKDDETVDSSSHDDAPVSLPTESSDTHQKSHKGSADSSTVKPSSAIPKKFIPPPGGVLPALFVSLNQFSAKKGNSHSASADQPKVVAVRQETDDDTGYITKKTTKKKAAQVAPDRDNMKMVELSDNRLSGTKPGSQRLTTKPMDESSLTVDNGLDEDETTTKKATTTKISTKTTTLQAESKDLLDAGSGDDDADVAGYKKATTKKAKVATTAAAKVDYGKDESDDITTKAPKTKAAVVKTTAAESSDLLDAGSSDENADIGYQKPITKKPKAKVSTAAANIDYGEDEGDVTTKAPKTKSASKAKTTTESHELLEDGNSDQDVDGTGYQKVTTMKKLKIIKAATTTVAADEEASSKATVASTSAAPATPKIEDQGSEQTEEGLSRAVREELNFDFSKPDGQSGNLGLSVHTATKDEIASAKEKVPSGEPLQLAAECLIFSLYGKDISIINRGSDMTECKKDAGRDASSAKGGSQKLIVSIGAINATFSDDGSSGVSVVCYSRVIELIIDGLYVAIKANDNNAKVVEYVDKLTISSFDNKRCKVFSAESASSCVKLRGIAMPPIQLMLADSMLEMTFPIQRPSSSSSSCDSNVPKINMLVHSGNNGQCGTSMFDESSGESNGTSSSGESASGFGKGQSVSSSGKGVAVAGGASSESSSEGQSQTGENSDEDQGGSKGSRPSSQKGSGSGQGQSKTSPGNTEPNVSTGQRNGTKSAAGGTTQAPVLDKVATGAPEATAAVATGVPAAVSRIRAAIAAGMSNAGGNQDAGDNGGGQGGYGGGQGGYGGGGQRGYGGGGSGYGGGGYGGGGGGFYGGGISPFLGYGGLGYGLGWISPYPLFWSGMNGFFGFNGANSYKK